MKKVFIALSLATLMSSCTVQFTTSLRNQLENSNVDLKKIQFYNSQSFALQREMSSSETGVVGGKIKISQGKKVEIIKINSKTPAVCDFSTKDTLYIIFEPGSNKRIPFVSDSYSKNYSLMTAGKGNVVLDIKNYTDNSENDFFGTINYDNNEYYYGYLTKPVLLVRKNQMEKILKDIRTVSGVKIQ